jgi:stage V sporulation protein AE
MFKIYLSVFIVGGLLCVIGQILLNKTTLKPANILVIYITAGVILSFAGLYEKLVNIGYAGSDGSAYGIWLRSFKRGKRSNY